MDKTVEISRRTPLIIQAWLLVVQAAMWSVISVVACDLDSPVLSTYALVIAGVTAVALLSRRYWLLSYCFLAAATMWGGSGAALAVTGHDGASVFMAFCLAWIHSGWFIGLGCRGVRRR